MKIRRWKTILGTTLAALALVFLFWAPTPHKVGAPKPGATVISVWHPWGGTAADDFLDAVKLFNETHPDIFAQPLFVPNDLSNSQKFYIAVAGGVPPDVTFVDGPQVAEWAHKGILRSLDDFVAQARIRPDDYWAPCWRQNEYDGHVWALTFCADPNFALFWNREVFRAAGLDPDRPPRTIEELDACNEKLIRFDENGRLVRLGLIPWQVYGGANSIFTWGWVFGGRFFDYENNRILANTPRIRRAMRWMMSYRKYGVEKIAALQQTFGSEHRDPFITGQVGLAAAHVTMLHNIRRFAPNLDFGIAPLPAPPDGEQKSSWVGGWCMALPQGSRGHEREAFEFIRWFCATPEGTARAARTTGTFPGYVRSVYYDEIRDDPEMQVFLDILRASKHQRPVMPAQAFFMEQLNLAVDRAVHGKMSPDEALDYATRETQRFLDRLLAEKRSRGDAP